jgi:hypothetical protein
MTKQNNDSINEIKETFQVNTDIRAAFFDLSSNFYNIREDEKGEGKDIPLDEVIIDIGGSFGDFDVSRIPWDAENRGYKSTDALWGVVSEQATTSLFNKMNDANQLSDISKLQFDGEKNNFTYESPLFMTTATTEEEKQGLVAAEQIVNLAYPIIFEMVARGEVRDTLKGLYKAAKASPKLVTKAAKAGLVTAKLLGNVLNVLSLGTLGALASIAKGAGKNAARGGIQLLGVVNKLLTGNTLKALTNVADDATKAAAKSAKKAASQAAAAAKAAAKAQAAAAKAALKAEKLAAKIAKEAAEEAAKPMLKLVGKVIQGFAISFVSLGAIPYIGPTLDIIYMVVVMPLMMALTMGGIIDGALTKVADPEGCCPRNSIALDELIPEAGMMIISNIPIIGDILSVFYPYVCSTPSGALVYKKALTQPSWMNYAWLTCYNLQWPEYNCRVGGKAPVFGKRYISGNPGSYSWDNEGEGDYTLLSLIVDNQEGYCQTIRKLKMGQKDDSEKQCIIPPGRGKFFYADFSEPLMLIDMARFYYNWAIKSPEVNEDGTVTIEYISKINYVVASSLYTCDIMCEMIAITFDPITGENYSETITYDRDRRFYYACDNSIFAPHHWEDNIEYRSYLRNLTDTYDLRMNTLNKFTFESRFNNTTPLAPVLHTAYTQMMDASNRYVFISNVTINNLSNDIFERTNRPVVINTLYNMVGSDINVKPFFSNITEARSNITKIVNSQLKTSDVSVTNEIMTQLSNIYTASNAITRFRYDSNVSDSYPSKTKLKNNQYTLVGCTHIDGTGPAAATPTVLFIQEDTRYRCNFDVTPYLIRCQGANMSISKCIDASNIELVIYNYLLQNPTKRIKTINGIKAKGVNACEFVWNEVIMNPVTKLISSSNNNVTTTVLYQQDLSSCTFSLPPPVGISGTSNYLFGSQIGSTSPITGAPSSVKMFKNPVDSSDLNYSNYTQLAYKEAKFKFPQFTPPKTVPTSFVESNVDYVPRYNPITFTPMPNLIRPRKPIRIFYPGEEESNLGNYTSNYCSDAEMLQRVLLSYNGNSNNTNKIVQIVRTFTSSSNTCDMEVDVMYPATNHVKRQTMTMNMVEGFQTASSGSNRRFNYQSVDSTNNGLNITRTTDTLSNPFQEGVNYGDPYLRSFQKDVGPYTTFFNDDLIKGFTSKTKAIRDNTNRLLVGLTGTRHLGLPPCTTKCQEPVIVQRIIEQYNKDNAASTRLDAENNSVIQVLNSATNSSNTCHVLLQNKLELYGDFYSNNKNSASNYYTENRLKFKKVLMEDEGNCSFYPVPNQTYQDISASDLALSSSANFNTYVTPKRIDCPPVNCGDPNLYNSAFSDYENKTGNTLSNAEKYIAIGKNRCDYLIKSTIELSDGIPLTVPNEEDEEESGGETLFDLVLRVNYDAPLYRADSTANCAADFNYTYSYNPDNFVLQVPLDLSDSVANPEYYQVVDSNSKFGSPLIGEIDDNATIRSAVHNIAQ